jgi:protein tyrosine phosphatase (PTP) superfamily phosphohydrolase (DUF442 family)
VIRRLMLAFVVFGLALAAGCKHHRCGHHGRNCDPCTDTARPFLPSAPRSPFLLPPAGVPTTPAPAPGGSSVIPPVGPMDLRNYPPPMNLKPAPEVLLPDPLPGNGSSRSNFPGNAGYGVLGTPVKPTAEPPKAATAPTGLAGYTRVKEGAASGRKPTLDGFDALKQAGFRTVVYLHASGADVSAAKEVAAKRGLAFVALETTPEKLAEVIEQFNAVVADKARQPIYVFDDDGLRAGAVWYLHFRTAEAMNDDAARVRARPLGLTEEGDEAKAFGLATQRILETR